MNTTAVLTCFHKYTPFGDEFYEPILSYYLQQMWKYKDEYDALYLLDSTWNISPNTYHLPPNVIIIKVNPSLRYFDAYKSVLSQIKEESILLMDNDMTIYKKGIIDRAFTIVDPLMTACTDEGCFNYQVVSIYDTIGTWQTDKMHGKNKFCPYFFAITKDLLMKYMNTEWGPEMPDFETLGRLTKVMIEDGIKPYEMEEDKSNILFDGTQDGAHSKDLGYYHIRSGSVPAYLLATRKYGDRKTFEDYIHNQPKSEYLRQFAWYWYMIKDNADLQVEVLDLLDEVDPSLARKQDFPFLQYCDKMKAYHGLP